MIDDELAAQMYRALRSLPCRCARKWDKETTTGFVVVLVCGRCKAMRAYEQAIGDLATQT